MNKNLHLEGESRQPWPMYDVAGARAVEASAIDAKGEGHGYTLMQRAGEAAAEYATGKWARKKAVAIFAGGGNNGGDGYAMATALAGDSHDSVVFQVAQPATDDARKAAEEALAAGVEFKPVSEFAPRQFKLVADAIVGIGLTRAPEGDMVEAIERINASGLPVLALDVATGIDASTGNVPGAVVDAQATLSFITYKIGTLTGTGRRYSGDVTVDEIRASVDCFAAAQPVARVMHLPLRVWRGFTRNVAAHKGECGHVLVVGGDTGMGGAVRLAAEAALRAGAGLVTVATSPDNVAPIVSARPELMVHGVTSPSELKPLADRADVIAVGPGLGQSTWGNQLLGAVLDHDKPTVVDADALNLLAQSPERRDNWVLTPHPGEAATLLGSSTTEIGNDRVSVLRQLRERFGGTVVLKGAGTLALGPEEQLRLCRDGNPGMATAGSGDVLTGIVASLVAQGGDLETGTRAGILLHAAAGDLAAEEGMHGMVAGDLIAQLRQAYANMLDPE